MPGHTEKRLFLCSHFSSVAPLFADQAAGKNVAFIPTAALHESYTGYVGSARKAWKKLGAQLTELEIARADSTETAATLRAADIIYFSGGNSFFLMDQLVRTDTVSLVRERVAQGAWYVGESAGAVVCAPDIAYIEAMDAVPDDYGQSGYAGLALTDTYIVPHYLTAPFKKASQQIVEQYRHLPLQTLTNKQAWLSENGRSRVVETA